MTVDEILATGQYTDRRGRVWRYDTKHRFWLATPGLIAGWKVTDFGGPIDDAQMRLLIERDQHRDECDGLGYCLSHPVPHVIVARYRPAMFSIHEAWVRREVVGFRGDLPAAVDAARALAVGE